MSTLSRYMVGSKAQAQPLTSVVELLQLLHFHTTDIVYLVHPTGIRFITALLYSRTHIVSIKQ